jgi:iron complex outermembrane receptor protein
VLDGHRLAGVPAVFARLGVRGSIGHGWLALEHTLSGQLWADDANTVRVEPWQGSTVRGGWELATGRMQLAPFVGVSNLWNERYAGSVAINGFGGRVFETAAGRSVYAGVEAAF